MLFVKVEVLSFPYRDIFQIVVLLHSVYFPRSREVEYQIIEEITVARFSHHVKPVPFEKFGFQFIFFYLQIPSKDGNGLLSQAVIIWLKFLFAIDQLLGGWTFAEETADAVTLEAFGWLGALGIDYVESDFAHACC